jgi:hypothetical protein
MIKWTLYEEGTVTHIAIYKLQDDVPEVSPSRKCHVDMGLIFKGCSGMDMCSKHVGIHMCYLALVWQVLLATCWM